MCENKFIYKKLTWVFVFLFLIPNMVSAGEKLKVATSFAPITNIVHNIGGCRIDLHGIIPEGVDSHTFEPIASDLKSIIRTNVIFLNGLDLELLIERMAKKVKRKGVEIVRLGDKTIKGYEKYSNSFPESNGKPNPHLWNNPVFIISYAEQIRDKLKELDPQNSGYYEQNAAKYIKRLKEVDAGIQKAIGSIPEKNRKLLTYHDSFAYFADRYGMTVIGAIQPSDFSVPSAREVIKIINQIKDEDLPAIFGSEVFPSKIIKQIGNETKVKTIKTLRDDNLPGKPEDPEHSYIGMLLDNVSVIVESLGGNKDILNGIETSNIITCP